MTEERPNDKRPNAVVGYCKPPVHAQWKKGQSGNPRGRPPKPKQLPGAGSLDEGKQRAEMLFLDEAYRMIEVRDGDKTVSVSAMQAIYRGLAIDAIKGSHKARELFDRNTRTIEERQRQQRLRSAEALIEYKMTTEAEIAAALHAGRAPPDTLPHPDDIIVDHEAGTVKIIGPMTREDRDELLEWSAKAKAIARECERYSEEIEAADNDQSKQCLLQ